MCWKTLHAVSCSNQGDRSGLADTKGRVKAGVYPKLKLSLEHASEGDALTCSALRTTVISLLEGIWSNISVCEGFPDGASGKESACKAGDIGLILGTGRSPGEGNSNPLQYSWVGNPMDRGAWQATVSGVTESQTQLSTDSHTLVCEEERAVCLVHGKTQFFTIC